MNKISFPRVGVDGKKWTQEQIEEWYLKQVKGEIEDRLKTLEENALDAQERGYINKIRTDIKEIIIAHPILLEKYTLTYKASSGLLMRKGVRGRDRTGKAKEESLRSHILKAFNYSGYRLTVLVELAKILNVKSCPYCNMTYTLYAESGIISNSLKAEGIARFQYDHFYPKSDYPWLSMSLYNLIPSCPFCNQVKSVGKLSLFFNPYYGEIGDLFHFEVEREKMLPLLSGNNESNDIIKVTIINDSTLPDIELKKYDNQFHISEIYGRHGDVVKEIFAKTYLYPYYSNPDNFKFLLPTSSIEFERLWLGTYPDKKDIERRPLTKFMQDIWKQAMGE